MPWLNSAGRCSTRPASGESVYKFVGPPLPSAANDPVERPDLDWSVALAAPGRNLKIKLYLQRNGHAQVGLYSMEGRLLQILHNGRLPAGNHEFEREINFPQGAYIVGLQLNEGVSVRKILLQGH